jgi:hypothetical protein
MKHDAVAEELDGAPTVGLSGVGNELSQPSGQTCSRLVSRLFRQARVAAEIEKGDGRLA